MKLLRFISLLLTFIFNQSYAFECFVVSDHKNFKGELVNYIDKHAPLVKKETSIINGKQCHILSNWDSLTKAVEKHAKKDEDILVFSISHGGKNGDLYINNETQSAKKTLGILDHLSQTRKVAAVIESCHSGDILKLKIQSDTREKASSKNLCMFTSSDFGENSTTSYHDQYLNQSNINYHLTGDVSGKNIEEVMSSLHHGLISSAPWETIAKYLKDRSLENALAVFETLNKANVTAYCNKLGDGESFLVADDTITDADIELIRSEDMFNITKTERRLWIQDLERASQNTKGFKQSTLKKVSKMIMQNIDSDDYLLYKIISKSIKKMNDMEKGLYNNHFLLPSYQETKKKLKTLERKRYVEEKFEQLLRNEFSGKANFSQVSVEGKTKILREFLGEYNRMYSSSNDKDFYYTDHLTRTFINGGIKIPNLANPIDNIRRDACRNFVFE